jgi:hypothetical protein
MTAFEQCSEINDLLNAGNEAEARDKTIIMLDKLKRGGIAYSPLVNSIIRSVGLFPYIDESTCDWTDRFVIEAFSSNIGGEETGVLHRE